MSEDMENQNEEMESSFDAIKATKIVVVNAAGEREAVFDLEDLRMARPGFITRMLLWLVPRWGVARLAREMGYPSDEVIRASATGRISVSEVASASDGVEQVHQLFKQAQRVDVLPSIGGGRGFQIVLDGTLSLYFFQDGDHFVYDGFELGEYERGDVTLFDEECRCWERWEEGQWGEE